MIPSLRQVDRPGRDIDSSATAVRGLPLLPEDKVWDGVRRGGLDELRLGPPDCRR
jgi:hypothetical protein